MSTHDAPRSYRAVPLVLGSIAVVVALALAVAGAVTLWAHETQRDADGYLTTPTGLLATPTHALVSETAHIEVGRPDWLFDPGRFGTVRVEAEGPHGLPVFVGIGPAAEVDEYLAGVRHDEVTELDRELFIAGYTRNEGGAPAAAPGEQGFWTASAEGTGAQTLTFELADGDWRLVALNPDGSAGVEAYVRFGAEVAFLGILAWSLIGVAAGLFALGLVLIIVGARAGAPPAEPSRPAAPTPPDPRPPAPERELVGAGREENTT